MAIVMIDVLVLRVVVNVLEINKLVDEAAVVVVLVDKDMVALVPLGDWVVNVVDEKLFFIVLDINVDKNDIAKEAVIIALRGHSNNI